MDPGQNANRDDGGVALTKAQRLSRYQSLRMHLTKSTGRLFAIPSLLPNFLEN